MPGPGQYSPRKGEGASGFAFGSSEREIKHSEMGPGPGSYEYKTVTYETHGYTMGGRHDDLEPRPGKDAPGPGTYTNVQGVKSSAGIKIGSEPRGAERASDVPGPGSYEHVTVVSEGPKWVMGTGGRTEMVTSKDIGPGPGQYKYYEVVTETKGITMGGRPHERAPDDIPGPGSYKAKTSIGEGPAYK